MNSIRGLVFLGALLFCNAYGVKDDLDDLVNYVAGFIDYSNNYVLPENNSIIAHVDDPAVNDYGTYDFIVVGAGAAGALLTRRLTEITNWNILLLEAGGEENQATEIPFLNLFTRNSEYNWGYTTVPQNNSCLGMVDHKCVYPVGKGLGGSTIIGDSVYARGNRADFDEWADLGLKGWGYDDILKYFIKTEQIQIKSYDKEYHGTDGLVKINYTYPNPVTYDAYLAAANAAGLSSLDYNGEKQIGVGKFQWTIDFNKKVSAGNAIIKPIVDKSNNLNVTLNAYTTKVLFSEKKDRAIGVQFIKNGKIYNAYANKEVILSAGAVGSAQLLLLSGVGPQEELKELNITVVKDLPVGKNLTDHAVYVGLYVKTNLTSDAGELPDNLRRWSEGLGYYTTVFSADNIAFINTKKPGVEPPNAEILTINPPTSVPPPTFYNLNEAYANVFSTINTLSDMLVYTLNLEPKSRGWLKLKSNDPADFPLINPGYYTDEKDEDIAVVYESIQYIIKLLEQPSLRAVNATLMYTSPECEDLKKKSDKDYWYCAIRALTCSFYEPTGTTPMGKDAKDSVLDDRARVHGIAGLRVVDSGTMPIIVRGHTMAAVWVIAEKVADLIKEDYGVL